MSNSNRYPDLSNEQIIGFDTETYDPGLLEEGPGWGRGWGNIVGVSLATTKGKWYFPLRHTVSTEDNYDLDTTRNYLRDMFSNKRCIYIAANAQYDMGWLAEDGIYIRGKVYDVQFAEALIDARARSYSLDNLARKYLNETKTDEALYQWCAEHYPGKADRKQAGNIWRAPPELVRPYAEDDAQLPIRIFMKQAPILEKLGLDELFEMECRLLPLLVAMRRRGMPVDLQKAEQARDDLALGEKLLRGNLQDLAGFRVNVNSRADLQKLFDKFNIEYEYTDKGNPSFTASWLTQQHHPAANLVKDIRRTVKARNDFIEKAIIDKAVNNKIFPSFHPLRSDSGGTVTGRFSSSQPNSQQFPSRDEELAPIVRGIFVPEGDYPLWCKMDFSQIEYRCFAHFSEDEHLIDAYSQEGSDFHAIVGDILGLGPEMRKPVKNINFMMLYGGGQKKVEQMLADLDLDLDPKEFIKLYHKQFPAAKELMDKVSGNIDKVYEVRTVLNRRTAFDMWVPKMRGISGKEKKAIKPLPYQAAYHTYGPELQIADTYKGLNYLLQGSAADIMKKGMLDAWESGIFNRTGIPHCTVHDELDFSYHPDLHADFMELREIMENAIKLKVPVIMDMETGPSWGEVK